MLKIGIIDYINALPFLAAFKSGAVSFPAQFVLGVPSALNRALRRGDLDISMISSAEFLHMPQRYALIPPYCIGASDKVMSVALYTRLPLKELDGALVAVTGQSSTSVELLRLLCTHYWKINPHFTIFSGNAIDIAKLPACPAFLLIGDECLQNPHFPGYTTVDLAQAWHLATGLSFVFAVFAANSAERAVHIAENLTDDSQKNTSVLGSERISSQVTKAELAEFSHALGQALDWAKKNPALIHQMAIEKSRLSPEIISAYFQVLQHTMTPQHMQGLEKFRALSSMHTTGQIPPEEPEGSEKQLEHRNGHVH